MNFNEILTMIIDSCVYNFYSGEKGREEKIIECATQIYIKQMEIEKEKKQ